MSNVKCRHRHLFAKGIESELTKDEESELDVLVAWARGSSECGCGCGEKIVKKADSKDSWHLYSRPTYYRGNFDVDEGPYNRVNRPGDNFSHGGEMVLGKAELEEIKNRDIKKKREQKMKMEAIKDHEKYPDTTQPAPKNDIFTKDESYYKDIYTNRDAEVKDLLHGDREKLTIIKADKKAPITKESSIRGKDVRPCPFGLPIPEACDNAGGSVARMAPIGDDENEEVAKANRLVYAYHKEGRKCPYAEKVLEDFDKVSCDFGDTGAGMGDTSFRGSPLYPQTFHGIGLDGLYGYPLGFYADNNESRNLFFGLFSLLGHATVEDLIKLGDKYDRAGEDGKADILDNLLSKLQKIKEEYKDTFGKIEKYLSEYRSKYEDKRTDTGLLWDLSDAWFGPRQVNR